MATDMMDRPGIKIVRYARARALDDQPRNFALSCKELAYQHVSKHMRRHDVNFVTINGRACFTLEQADRQIREAA